MKPWNRPLLASLSLFTLIVAAPLRAEPILPFFEGEIDFGALGGAATPTGGTVGDDGVMSMADATGIDFDNSGDGSIFVTYKTDDFAAIPYFTAVTFYDIVFNPATPANPLWRIVYNDVVYEFSARTFNVNQGDNYLNLWGRGSISATGYQESEGAWNFDMGRTGLSFNWSAGTAIPVPGTLALFCLGLAGMALCRRVTARPLAAG